MNFKRTRGEFLGRRTTIRRIFKPLEKRNLMNMTITTLITKSRM